MILQPYGTELRVRLGAKRPAGLRRAAAATSFRPRKNRVTVYLPPEPSMNDVVHEAYHVTNYVLTAAGVIDDEAYAYLVAHVVDLLLESV